MHTDNFFSWVCPYCNRHATIQNDIDTSEDWHVIQEGTAKKEGVGIVTKAIICPNSNCKEITLSIDFCPTLQNNYQQLNKYSPLHSWNLLPTSKAKTFPDYIPKAIRQDYEESCSIVHLSPKAAATLARRCLQGIIRNYFKITKGSLKDEIDALKEKVDHTLWEGIDAVRSVGNIGAHMEKDVQLIIDIEPHEAEQLIWLIEFLIEETYITQHQKKEKLAKLKELSEKKKTKPLP